MPTRNTPFDYGTREYYQYIGRLGGRATAERRSKTAAETAAVIRSQVIASVRQIVYQVVATARENVKADPHIPDDIAEAISVGSISEGFGGLYVDIIVDVGEDSIDDRRGRRAARAFEYGSGEFGGKGRYPISAVNFPNLSFFWEAVSPLGFTRKKVAKDEWMTHLTTVMHPGVPARPYLKPAVMAHLGQLKATAKRAFKDAFLNPDYREDIGV